MAITANQAILIQQSADGKFWEAFTVPRRATEPPNVTLISRSATASTVTTAVALEMPAVTTGGT